MSVIGIIGIYGLDNAFCIFLTHVCIEFEYSENTHESDKINGCFDCIQFCVFFIAP